MATNILHKRSTTASAVPIANDLDLGELAINTADGKVFLKKGDNSIVEVGGGDSVVGSDTYVQFNDSGALGADQDFTFNKATQALTVGVTADGIITSGAAQELTLMTGNGNQSLNIIGARNVVTGDGGSVDINGGAAGITGAGGDLNLTAGASKGTNQDAAIITLITGKPTGTGAGGHIKISAQGITGLATPVRFYRGAGGGTYIALKAPEFVSTSRTITLPSDAPADGDVLTTTSAGVTSWVAPSDVSAYIPLTQKGANSGVATLDASGKIPAVELPPIAITDTFVVASQVAMLALTAQTGDVAVRSDLNENFILQGTDPATLGDWVQLLTPTDSVLSVNGNTGAVTLTAADVGAVDVTGGTMTGPLNVASNVLKMYSGTYNAGASLYTNVNDQIKMDLFDGAGTWLNQAFSMTPSTGNVNFLNYVQLNGGANFLTTPTSTPAAPTLANQLTRKDYVDAIPRNVLNGASDLNALANGLYSWAGVAPLNAPVITGGNNSYGILTQTTDSAQQTQFAYSGIGSGEWMAVRRKDSGVWNAWKPVATQRYVDDGRPMTATINAYSSGISRAPTGWSCARTGTGSYTVTHNMALSANEYAGAVLMVSSVGTQVPIIFAMHVNTANSFQYKVYDSNATVVDISHNISFQVGNRNT